MTHQKRIPAPKHYAIKRKDTTYVSTIKGSRSKENAIPAVVLLRDVLEYADNEKEAKEIIKNGDLKRNGDTVRDVKEGIGILDVVEIPETEETYRAVRDGKYIRFIPVEDSKVAAKIQDKDVKGDRFIYRLHNGENYSTKDEYSTGNTLIFNSGVTEVELEEGAEALVIKGQHAGDLVEVKEMRDEGMQNTAVIENDREFETDLENLVAVEDIKVQE
jgi:small subunit ribosomal protein S4e